MSDLISATFDDLDEYYPGSTQRRRESREARKNRMAQERQEAKEEEGWDAHPKKCNHPTTGQPLELFHIGALAKALNRRPVTIRSWITKGWIPKAQYRTEGVSGSAGDAGRRLWNRAQIEGMQRIAREEGLLNPRPPSLAQIHRFTERVVAEYRSWL